MKSQGAIPGLWWALLRSPDGLPVLFRFKEEAQMNRDADEYLVQVNVRPHRMLDLLKGRRWSSERAFSLKAGARALKKLAKQDGLVPVPKKKEGAIVDLKGYVEDLKCPKCRKVLEASHFVKLCKLTDGGLALSIALLCSSCAPSWPVPFVSGLRFLNSRTIIWRQRTRRGLFGPPLQLEEMELRRMPEKRDGRPVFRPQPKKARHKRTPRPRVPVEEKSRRGSIKVNGAGLLRSALNQMAPLMRQRFGEAMALEAEAIRKGGGRAAPARSRR